jgi:hypothetical protein
MRFADVLIRGYHGPNGPEPFIVGEGTQPDERLSIQAFTDRQEAAASGTQFDFELVEISLREACKFAAYSRLDAIDINRSGYGYALNYTGMIDLLSGRAPINDYTTMQIEQVSASYEVPAAPPPVEFVDEIRSLAMVHRVQHVKSCCVVFGEAPAQLCFIYQPYPSHAFNLALLEVVDRWFKGKMTFTTLDLSAKLLPMPLESLAPLAP